MDIRWQGEIYIAAPYDAVYAYLADFARHPEWTQTIERLELIKPGDEDGVGAEYHAFERQGMQSNRAPGEPIANGVALETICEVRELCPSYRIAWRTRSARKPTMSSEQSFDLQGDPAGGTRLLQRIAVHTSKPYDMLDKLRNRTDPVILRAQLRAQWEAGLRNIKEILETRPQERQRMVGAEDQPVGLVGRERQV